MMPKLWRYILLGLVCGALILALLPAAVPPVIAQSDSGVATLTGKFTITNQDVLADSSEPEIVLYDMTAFVHRNFDEQLKFNYQPLGAVSGDISQGASYTLSLPIEPIASYNDVSNGKGSAKGVMIFSAFLNMNSIGDPFLGPFENGAWPGYDASIVAEPGTIEVTGGRLIVWSPDDAEMFPTG
ncbi:MAG TPA: hypothetical protein VMT34_05550, partial [Aggregatilineales bacterium]|nr:hypothetical protein [Aggregatilineales bacterium]